MSLHHDTGKLRFSMVFFCLSILIAGQSQNKTLGLLKKLPGNDENGYLLFSPIGSDTTYLINKCGKRVHSWRSQHSPGMSVYLKPDGHLLKSGTYTDTSFGFAGGRGGIIEEFDWAGNLIWRYKIFNDSLCQHHDIRLLPNGNVLVLAWHSISKNKAIALGRDSKNFGNSNELWGERIVELKPIGSDSAEIVWQWDIFDHIVQDRDSSLSNYGIPSQHPGLMDLNYALDLKTQDWIHANSLDYNPELDQILISAHNICEVWIIDHSTTKAEAASHLGGTFNRGGDILYRWGNPQAYGMGYSSDRKLHRQHNAQWIPGGYRDSGSVLIFNNGWGRDTAYSSVDIIRTPRLPNGSYNSALPFGPATAAWQYKDSVPTKFYSQIISGAQMLPNGNVLICSGVQGRFFEVSEKKKIVWEYRNPVNANTIQQDAQFAANNAVFRCEFYPSTFSGFTGKTLIGGSAIERASVPYSCQYENTAPVVVKSIPANGSKNVALHAPLKLLFSEAILKRSGTIEVFANNSLLESISISSDNVKISRDTAIITHSKAFPPDSRISVRVPASIFRDSSFNHSSGMDSSKFSFMSIRGSALVQSLYPAHQSQLQKPGLQLHIQYSRNVYKRSNGNISIIIDGQLAETIPVTSSSVTINDNNVYIKPSADFAANAFIMVQTDTCFADSFQMPALPVTYGNWYFRIADKPKVSALHPSKGSLNIGHDTALKIEFSRPVNMEHSGFVYVYAGGILHEQIDLAGEGITYTGNSMRIKPSDPLPENSIIHVSVQANTLKDSFGFYFGGIDTASWSFRTSGNASIHTGETKALTIYPQPAGRQLYVEGPGTKTGLILSDLCGRIIDFSLTFIEHLDTAVLELPELPKGLYLLYVNGRCYRISVAQ